MMYITYMSKDETAQVRCLRCHRPLRAARSIKAAYGPGCRARIRAAALAAALRDFTTAQIDKARELIADGGMVPTGFARVWRTVSTDGSAYYLSAPEACNCTGGRFGRRCYHSAAATILATTRKAA